MHTPLPWHVETPSRGATDLVDGNLWIVADGFLVAKAMIQGNQTADNARLIVTAVNSHAQLVELLGESLTFLSEYIRCNQVAARKGLPVPKGSPAPYELQGKIREALCTAGELDPDTEHGTQRR